MWIQISTTLGITAFNTHIFVVGYGLDFGPSHHHNYKGVEEGTFCILSGVKQIVRVGGILWPKTDVTNSHTHTVKTSW